MCPSDEDRAPFLRQRLKSMYALCSTYEKVGRKAVVGITVKEADVHELSLY